MMNRLPVARLYYVEAGNERASGGLANPLGPTRR
jgi:hypothetical protein